MPHNKRASAGKVFLSSSDQDQLVLSYLFPSPVFVEKKKKVVSKPVQLSLFPDAALKVPDRPF